MSQKFWDRKAVRNDHSILKLKDGESSSLAHFQQLAVVFFVLKDI